MRFPKIDVRENLLSNETTMRGAKIVEHVEIPLQNLARSKRALVLLSTGQAAMQTYRVDQARISYANGIEAARQDKDPVMAVAGVTLLAMLMDGVGPTGATLSSLRDGRDTLQVHIEKLQDQMIELRAKREDVLDVMQPRCDLLALIEHNIGQYEFAGQCGPLHESKGFVEKMLAQRKLETAMQIAATGIETATEKFGRDHWWCAVMDTRRAIALYLLGKQDEAAKLARRAIATFEEWSTTDGGDSVFLVDMTLMRQAVAGQLVF